MTAGGPGLALHRDASAHLIIAGYAIFRTTRRAPVPEAVREHSRRPRQTGTTQTPSLDPARRKIFCKRIGSPLRR
jgi:hypothetical protein